MKRFGGFVALVSIVFAFAVCTTTVRAEEACTVKPYFSPYDNIEQVVVDRLAAAQKEVSCSLYGITNEAITRTLTKLANKGVTVRMCLDKTQSAGRKSTHATLRAAGAEVVIKKTATLEHNKFCVVDGETVVMGSWNYSGSAQRQDNSMVDISGCPGVVGKFVQAFERIRARDK